MRFIKMTAYILLVGIWSTACANTLKVDVNGEQHLFIEPIRLAKLLAKVAQPEDVYWPSAALFVASDDVILRKQHLIRALTDRLTQLPKGAADQHYLANFVATLSTMQVARRVELVVDFERSRRIKKFNPLLSQGQFYLSAKPTSPNIMLLGAVEQSKALLSNTEVKLVESLYTDFANSSANNSWIFWSMDGANWQKTGIAYWNSQPINLAAGAILYIPFSSSVLGDDAELINQQILLVLRDWIR